MLRFEVLSMWVSLAALAGATVLYAFFFMSKRPQLSWYATFMTGLGFLSLTASIGLHSSAAEGSRLYGPYSIVLAAWALVLVYFIVEHLAKLKVYGTVLVPLALLGLIAAQLMGAGAPVKPPGAAELALLEGWRVTVHVVLIVFGNALFFIGAVASGAYLGLERQLKGHRTSTLFKRLPSLAQTDLIARRAIAIGFPVYTGGLLLGVLRAVETDIAGWWADPRVLLAGVVWALFGGYLHLQYRYSAARTAARLALVGVVLVIALAILARVVPAGFHVFAVPGA
ncbi:MAG TPA: cytochrome c biogenesis protein CcsA [Coriobacteriia bacterium]